MYFFPKTHKNKGFTLIELMMVISIISLLSSIVLASLSQAGKRSRDAVRLSDIKQIRNAIELYINDNKHAPFLNGCDQSNPDFGFNCKAYSSDSSGDTTPSWIILGTQLSNSIKKLPFDVLGKSNSSFSPGNYYRYIYYAPGYVKAICNRAISAGKVSSCDSGDSDYAITLEAFESSGNKKNGFYSVDPFGSY